MKSETFPLAVPQDLLREIRRAAKLTGLSMADVIRQSVKLGLPRLKQELSMEAVLKQIKPMTPEECRQCYQEPNPEFDALEHHMTERAIHPLPEDE